ncbi:MAG: prepilin-type N-terminal cleavage/methylation domain-containing protein [Deltaproteobacteria bacterium]|nr:prepilin-type N-terminal cleavage/methylation domain-containing protein [Deltaproteobacteria bacterium]
MNMAERIRRANDHGFTLVELLVALAIVSIVTGGIYSAYSSQQKTYVIQEDVASMQQNLRAAMYYLEREIRMAGYDPTDSGQFGLQASGSDGRVTDANNICFTVDDDEDGVVDNTENEQVAFRVDTNGNLQRYSTGAVKWNTVAENVNALNFVYLDGDNNVTTTLSQVRSIEITLQARTERTAPGYLRQKTLTTRVRCRNLGV